MIAEEEDEREAELSDEDLENDAELDTPQCGSCRQFGHVHANCMYAYILSEDEIGKIIYQTLASFNFF